MMHADPGHARRSAKPVALHARLPRQRATGHRVAKELDDIASRKDADVHYVTGLEIGDDQTDQLGIPAITRLVPDVIDRECFVCSPPPLIDAGSRRLQAIGVPDECVHFPTIPILRTGRRFT